MNISPLLNMAIHERLSTAGMDSCEIFQIQMECQICQIRHFCCPTDSIYSKRQ